MHLDVKKVLQADGRAALPDDWTVETNKGQTMGLVDLFEHVFCMWRHTLKASLC
jgi:hypothetical protein